LKRLTEIDQRKLDILRSANFQAEIQKISDNRRLQGDRIVFRFNGEFKEAILKIMKKYGKTSDADKRFVSKMVNNPHFPRLPD